jgi:protein SEY1
MRKIWESISKPAELEDRQLEDYFDLEFTTLPHKILMPDKFETEVAALRVRFADAGSDRYIFKPAYHKRIPADGVAFYMENIWVCMRTRASLTAIFFFFC